MPNETRFAKTPIDKSEFEQAILIGLGRDLQLPQAVALEQCRQLMPEIYQLWSDGFCIEYALKFLKESVFRNAQSDPDLNWLLQDQLAAKSA